MITRKLGEIGVTWKWTCSELGLAKPLGAGWKVYFVLEGGREYACTVVTAAAGLVSFKNTESDIPVGEFRYLIKIVTDASPAEVWYSDPLKGRVEEPFATA
jgi:hypothetical protein